MNFVVFRLELFVYRVFPLGFTAGFLCTASIAAAQQTANPFDSVGENQSIPAAAQQDVQVQTQIVDNTVQAGPSNASDTTIGAVNVQAPAGIPLAPMASEYETFIGQSASSDVLAQLANAVSRSARDQGYIFASVEIPAQAVRMGVVSVNLDPGPIHEVRIVGSDSRRLRRILDQLVCDAAQSAILERQLLLAGDLPDITVQNTRYVREEGKGILVVTVREQKARGYAALDNHGPSTLGPVRARLQLDISGLLQDSDVLTTSVTSTFAQPDELAYISARYAMTLGNGGTVVGISAAAGRTKSGGPLSAFDFRGRNRYAAVFASHSLKRSNNLNAWLNAELAYLEVQQSRARNQFQDDDIVTASINFSGNAKIGSGRIYGGVGVTQGLGILGASRRGDPLNSRSDAGGTFTKANFWVNSILNFGGGFGMRLAANAQIASRPLLSAQEISLGGPYFGRGYDFSERFGDEGVLALAEFRKDFNQPTPWLNWLQLYGFVDGGHVSHIGDGFGDGTLASAGAGMRAQLGRVDMGFEAAAPLNEDRFESGDQSPRINVQLGVQF